MEAISDTEYMQDSPISIPQAKEALETIAIFHASAWENKSLLQNAQDRLSKASYHLKTRNPNEVAGLPEAWTQFSKAFGIDDNDDEENLGKRIQDLAEYICDETSPTPTDKYATLSHGDCKAMNCFLPIHKKGQTDGGPTHRGVILVDFASTGVGLGMSDVVMFINHAVRPEHLENGGEEMLIDHYLDVLDKKLSLGGAREAPIYPREIALWHYKLAAADYFRFFLGRFWITATPETFEKKKDSKNTALINRDREAALRFLGRVMTFVSEIEIRRGQTA
jgi:Ser/Thr protein kinase RdoA (MazF antagonist)